MNRVLICLNAIIPTFVIIGAGYLSKLAGIVREEDVGRINAVAYRVFMLAMCFYNVYSSDLSSAIRPRLLLFTAGSVLILFVLSWAYAHRFVPQRDRKGVVIQGLFRSNYLIIGLPVAAGLLGDVDLGPAAVLCAVVVPIYNILAVIALEVYGSGSRTKPGKILLSILKNPLIVGSLTGLLFLLLGVRLPRPLETATRDMSRAASPLLLFLLGAFFRFNGIRSHLRELTAVCLGRLIVFPALALTAAAALGFRGLEFVALLGVFGSATASNSFVMAQQMGGDARLAGDIVVMTSLLCCLTLFGWSLLFKTLGLF